jgi:hypothetical protein
LIASRVEFEAASLPAFSGPDDINNVNTAIVQSGYITWIAQDQSSPQAVVIGLRSGFVNAGDPWPFSTSESQIANHPTTGGSADVRSFFLSNLTSFPQVGGTGGTLWRFSTATAVGTLGPTVIAAESVPEPAPGALTALALLTLVFLRCRRSANSDRVQWE